MSKLRIEDIKEGMKVKSYGFFSDLEVKSFNEDTVVLEIILDDLSVHTKTVYTSLFLANAKL